jgi:hypothetical protein
VVFEVHKTAKMTIFASSVVTPCGLAGRSSVINDDTDFIFSPENGDSMSLQNPEEQ